MAKKKKVKNKRGTPAYEVRNALIELQVIQKQGKPKVPEFDELFKYLDTVERRSYSQWDRKMRSQYGNSYETIAYLLLHPLKCKAIANADYWYTDLVMALSFEVLCAEICSNINDYMDDLISASITTQKKVLPSLSDPASSYSYEPCIANTSSIWFDMVYPDNMVNFLFNSEEAAGQPVTKQSLNAIISRMLCNTSHISIIAKITIEVYKSVIERMCKTITGTKEIEKKLLLTRIDSSELSKAAREQLANRNIGKDALFDLDTMIPSTITWFLSRDAHEMFQTYENKVDSHLLTLPETLIIGVASEALGISTKSVFHYISLRLADSIICKKPEILYGEVNEPNALPPIGFRTLTAISIIESKVQKQTAIRYSQIEGLEQQAKQKYIKANEEMEVAWQKQNAAEKKVKKTEREAAALKANIEKLEAALKYSEAKIETLTDILVQRDSEADSEAGDGDINADSPNNFAAETISFPVRMKKGFKVMVYGGHATWVGPMSQRFPDVTFRFGRSTYNYDGIKTQNLIIFQTNAISHSTSIPVKNEAQKASVPILNFTTAGVDSCSRQLYEILQENNALLEEEGRM